jgi:hypothetical protein
MLHLVGGHRKVDLFYDSGMSLGKENPKYEFRNPKQIQGTKPK